MSEYPLFFRQPSADQMVRAVIAGRKTQMRLPMDPQPEGSLSCEWYAPTLTDSAGEMYAGPIVFGYYDEEVGWKSPFGGPGDRLWVREKWRCTGGGDRFGIVYAASPPEHPSYRGLSLDSLGRKWLSGEHVADWKRLVYDTRISTGWRPSIHMSRWASRITLEVLRVWVQRVQEIRRDDALVEGVDLSRELFPGINAPDKPLRLFPHLWDSIYAKAGFGWDENPWVWACEFQLIENKTERNA